jgi:DNA-directed RNA polymerase specialized sigma24 family protein
VSSRVPPPPDGAEPLLAAHYLPVMRLCLSRLRDHADAEDATQEVFRRALQHAAELRENPLPWLITVAKNVCNDELRRRSRVAAPAVDAAATAAPTPEGMVVGRMAVMELLGRLTPGERRALASRMGGGEGGATSTTRVLLSRARQKARQYLEDSQAAFNTTGVYTTEALHRLRTTVFGRGLIGSGRAAVLIPAVLAIGVVGGSMARVPSDGVGPAAVAPPVSFGPSELARARHLADDAGPRDGGVIDRLPAGGPLGRSVPGAGTAAGELHLPPPSGATWYRSLPQDDYHQDRTWDIEPSPTYASDHTVMMVASDHTCQVEDCARIYRSTDGGYTWSLVTANTPTARQILLPRATYSAGHFYLAGQTGVQSTRDNGSTFEESLIVNGGLAMTPPESSGFDVILGTTNTLWGVRPDGSSTLLATLNGPVQTYGFPVLLPTPTGYVVLEPVTPLGYAHPMVERCTPTCSEPVAMNLSTNEPTLVASPDVATDHIVYAVIDGLYMSVSHDDGHTYTVVGGWAGAADVVGIHGPAGRRLVGALGIDGRLGYSDDDGVTWHVATIPSPLLTQAHTITQLRPGRLIASMMRSDDYGWYYFVCSTDGTAWTACTPDGG